MTLGEFRMVTEKYGGEIELCKADRMACADDYATSIDRVIIEITDGTTRIILI